MTIEVIINHQPEGSSKTLPPILLSSNYFYFDDFVSKPFNFYYLFNWPGAFAPTSFSAVKPSLQSHLNHISVILEISLST